MLPGNITKGRIRLGEDFEFSHGPTCSEESRLRRILHASLRYKKLLSYVCFSQEVFQWHRSLTSTKAVMRTFMTFIAAPFIAHHTPSLNSMPVK
jgi:hypothetical protein